MWCTVSSDVANATAGDAATKALVVKGASSEGKSSFTENSASGPLSFMDASTNSVFSLVPGFSLAPGQSLKLLFTARFDNTILQIPACVCVRTEVIVTFGNSGCRGGSGASGANIDINGNGVIDLNEKYVRSVPTRICRCVPMLEKCNDTVTLVDTDIAATGSVTYSNLITDIGGGTGVEVVNASVERTVIVEVDGGAVGGAITNTATLTGATDIVVVKGPINPATGQPYYSFNFICCLGVDLAASHTQNVAAVPFGFQAGDFTTYTQGGWGAPANGSNPGAVLTNNFTTVYPITTYYPSGCEVGILGSAGFSMKFSTAAAVIAYLPAGGPAAALNADLMNPASTSAGVYGGLVLALRLNVNFSAAGVTQGPGGAFGTLKLAGTGTALDGLTVAQVLAACEQALGGGALPAGMTIGDLNSYATALNESFDNGAPSAWAVQHLTY